VDWGVATRSYPAFAVSQSDISGKTETYEILRRPEGGRKDAGSSRTKSQSRNSKSAGQAANWIRPIPIGALRQGAGFHATFSIPLTLLCGGVAGLTLSPHPRPLK
jgi:hypothetical protein